MDLEYLIGFIPLIGLSLALAINSYGGNYMSEKVQSIVTIVISIISIIITLIATTKNTNSKIRDTQDRIRDTQDRIRDTQDKIDNVESLFQSLNELVESSVGTKNTVKGSLTDQHEDLKSLIKEKSKATYDEVHEINVRSDKEKTIREEREKHLSPEMLEIKNVLDAVTSQNTLLGNMKVELDNYKSELYQCQSELAEQKIISDKLLKENAELKKKIQVVPKSEKDELFYPDKGNGKSI